MFLFIAFSLPLPHTYIRRPNVPTSAKSMYRNCCSHPTGIGQQFLFNINGGANFTPRDTSTVWIILGIIITRWFFRACWCITASLGTPRHHLLINARAWPHWQDRVAHKTHHWWHNGEIKLPPLRRSPRNTFWSQKTPKGNNSATRRPS